MLDSRPDRDIIGMANDRTVYRIGMKNPRLCYVGFFSLVYITANVVDRKLEAVYI